MKRALVLCTALALAASGIVATPVLAATPTTTVIDVTPAAPEVGQNTCLSATVTTDVGAWTNGGNLVFSETTSGTPVVLSYVTLNSMPYPSIGYYCSSDLSLGTHTFVAEYSHLDTSAYEPSSDEITIEIGQATPNITVSAAATIEAHHNLAVQVLVTSTSHQYITGTVELWHEGGSSPECSKALTLLGTIDCTLSGLPIGTYQFYGKFLGDTETKAGQGDSSQVTVIADQLHLAGVGVQYPTFYPIKDGYKDTLKISGTRGEPLSGTIRIYRPTGALLKTVSIGTGSGTYSFIWTGRDSAGAVLPEGKYRIVQTLSDGYSTKATTSYSVLSKKHLIWHSSTITKNGSALSTWGVAGNGTVAVNTTSHTVRLRAGSSGYDAAGAGWQFTLPAGISYRAVTVGVYAKHPITAGGPTRLGAQDFADCAYNGSGTWYESCFDTWKSVGNAFGSLQWYSTSALTATHRYGRIVRSLLVTYTGTTYVYKARVTCQYSTLGY